MTNEKAVEILKAYKQKLEVSCSNQLYEDIEAFDIAIQAIETGEVYMAGKDYNLYLEGYKEGMSDYKKIVKENEELKAELKKLKDRND